MNIRPVFFLSALATVILLGGGLYFLATTLNPSAPDLDRPFTPLSTHPESIQEDARAKVKNAVAQLSENPELTSAWLELAVYRKGAGDYEGAEEIWLYMTRHWPEDVVAYGNLADLYQNYLDRPKTAEAYWRKILDIRTDLVPVYRNLHDLYRTKLNDSQKARAILEQGLSVIEEARDKIDLLVPLAIFERDQGNLERAREHFIAAKQMADFIGQVELAGLLQAELDKLP